MFRALNTHHQESEMVLIQHLVYFTLPGITVEKELPDRHTRQSPTQCEKYQMPY